MYRPTVRLDNVYRDYINDVFRSTSLDRNQIFRLALFIAAHTDDFKEVLKECKKADVPLPSPKWEPWEYGYWREATYKPRGGGKDVNAKTKKLSGERTARTVNRVTTRTTVEQSGEAIQNERRVRAETRQQREIHGGNDGGRQVIKCTGGGIKIRL